MASKQDHDRPIVTRGAPWREMVVVCRKCGKKMGGGFGRKQRESLPRALKTLLRTLGQNRRVRIIESGCLGLCPKKAVTVASDSLPGRMLVVPRGTDPALVVRHLLGDAAIDPQPETRSILAPQPESLRSTAS